MTDYRQLRIKANNAFLSDSQRDVLRRVFDVLQAQEDEIRDLKRRAELSADQPGVVE